MKRIVVPAKVGGGSAALGIDIAVLQGGRGRAQAPAIDIADLSARLIIVVLFTLMAIRIGSDFLATGRLTGLLLLASETLVVALTVMRRSTADVDRSYRARLLTALSILGPALVQPAMIAALAPELVTVLLSAAGLLVVIGGKLSLGRSFGLMPANRGVVSSGLYRLVRHPIYMGYLITHAGFLLANPTMWNILMVVGADLALMRRAVCEEQTLAKDDAYRAYQQTVRWRVLPGVF
jgi:protein-S-isoprenylcysteine O-methyltransferase Ste14